MAVVSNLNNRSALDPRWGRWALRTLDAFESCIISIYDMNTEDAGRDFHPFAPPGGQVSRSTKLFTGPAQMQVYRQTLTMDDVAGSVTQVRSVRFTTGLDGPNFPVRKGLVVRVDSNPHDPDAENYEYIVTSGLNSGLAWKRTIECEVDMAVIVGPIVT